MTPETLMWLTLGGLLIAAISACGTKVLYEFSRHELENYCRVRQNRELFAKIVAEHDQVAMGVENLKTFGQGLFLIAGVLWVVLSGNSTPDTVANMLIIPLLAAGFILLLSTVWIPGSIAHIWSAPFLYHTWRLWKITSAFFFPINFAGIVVDTVLHRLAGKQQIRPTEEEFEKEIRAIVNEGVRDGHLEEDAINMIAGVIELGDVDVADIMTPRSEVDAMDVTLTLREALDLVTRVRRTRIPVYEKSLDNIVGVLHVKDLLPELSKDAQEPCQSIRELLRKASSVPKTKPVNGLLQEFQKSRNHLAIVIDEFSSVAGIVTIEDALEEIVGEIVDEYDVDNDEEEIIIENGFALMAARMHIDEINEQLGLDLPEDEEFDTIGGFVSMRLGHIPTAGEQLKWENTRFTVLEASRRRVERIRIDFSSESQRESA